MFAFPASYFASLAYSLQVCVYIIDNCVLHSRSFHGLKSQSFPIDQTSDTLNTFLNLSLSFTLKDKRGFC